MKKVLFKQELGSTRPAIRCNMDHKSIAIWQNVWVEFLSPEEDGSVDIKITPQKPKKEIKYMISGLNTTHVAKELFAVLDEDDMMLMELGF